VPIVEEVGRESVRWRREEKTISRPPLGCVLVWLVSGDDGGRWEREGRVGGGEDVREFDFDIYVRSVLFVSRHYYRLNGEC